MVSAGVAAAVLTSILLPRGLAQLDVETDLTLSSTSSSTATSVAATSTSVPETVAAAPTTTRSGIEGTLVGVPDPAPPPAAPEPSIDPEFVREGLAEVAAGGADLHTSPDSEPFVRAQERLLLPVLSRSGDWLEVFTPCDEAAWMRIAEASVVAPAPERAAGSGFDFAEAVIVVDAGHGGPNNIGAVGRSGTEEKQINQQIALRLRDLLAVPHLIDWETGRIYEGDAIPAAKRVLLTRPASVGDAGDFEAGLTYRAAVANSAGASVLVSIHNNAGHEVDLDMPGSDVFYQSQIEESRRLATILAEEFQLSFARFDAPWVGATEVGAKSRLSPRDGETQYYGVLRRSEVPAVIAEGSYLSNPAEEALLKTPQFQQAYAEAVYRSVVRFLTTDDYLPGSTDPEVWAGQAGSGAPAATCEIPAQP